MRKFIELSMFILVWYNSLLQQWGHRKVIWQLMLLHNYWSIYTHFLHCSIEITHEQPWQFTLPTVPQCIVSFHIKFSKGKQIKNRQLFSNFCNVFNRGKQLFALNKMLLFIKIVTHIGLPAQCTIIGNHYVLIEEGGCRGWGEIDAVTLFSQCHRKLQNS